MVRCMTNPTDIGARIRSAREEQGLTQDQLAKMDPEFWYFWIGLLLVLLVMFARGGILGLLDRLVRR